MLGGYGIDIWLTVPFRHSCVCRTLEATLGIGAYYKRDLCLK